jgi:hypothetical protein
MNVTNLSPWKGKGTEFAFDLNVSSKEEMISCCCSVCVPCLYHEYVSRGYSV